MEVNVNSQTICPFQVCNFCLALWYLLNYQSKNICIGEKKLQSFSFKTKNVTDYLRDKLLLDTFFVFDISRGTINTIFFCTLSKLSKPFQIALIKPRTWIHDFKHEVDFLLTNREKLFKYFFDLGYIKKSKLKCLWRKLFSASHWYCCCKQFFC